MDTDLQQAQDRARTLVADVRATNFTAVSPNGQVLALAALMRAAHLLDAMLKGPRVHNDPLIELGFRDVLETTINGLFCLARPDEIGRFVRADLDARAKIAGHLNRADDMTAFLGQFADQVQDCPGQMHFGQRLDVVAAEVPGVLLDADDVGRAKAMYAALSNFGMHGGAGILGAYLEELPNEQGLHPLTHPERLIDAAGAIDMATGMLGKLHRVALEILETSASV